MIVTLSSRLALSLTHSACFFFCCCCDFCCADPKKIFPGQDANAKVAQVQKFLAQLPCMKLPLVPATARAYDTATIEAIEKYGDSYTAARTAAKKLVQR